MNTRTQHISWAFFGSSDFSVHILNEMHKLGYTPSVIISTPDKPRGRKMLLTPTVVSLWAQQHSIPVYTPEKLRDPEVYEYFKNLCSTLSLQVFIVASYGKIIPDSLLNLPPRETLNIHPSLLPKYRGASPIHSAMLADDITTGVSIIRLDSEMDHGPLIGPQIPIDFVEWPPYAETEKILAEAGARALAHILPQWISEEIREVEQDHSQATYTQKITKEQGHVDTATIKNLENLPEKEHRQLFLKIQAYSTWPRVFFFTENNTRCTIVKAQWKNNSCHIETVIPEGKKETSWSEKLLSI